MGGLLNGLVVLLLSGVEEGEGMSFISRGVSLHYSRTGARRMGKERRRTRHNKRRTRATKNE